MIRPQCRRLGFRLLRKSLASPVGWARLVLCAILGLVVLQANRAGAEESETPRGTGEFTGHRLAEPAYFQPAPFAPSVAGADASADLGVIYPEDLPQADGPAVALTSGIFAAPAMQGGGGIYAYADVIYWNVTEGSAENWAQEITPKGLGTTYGTAELVDAPFDWRAGLRVGVGLVAGDGFDVDVSYTNFSTTANNTAAGEVYSAYLGNFYAGNVDGGGFGPYYRRAEMEWDVSFQTIDLELGQTMWLDRDFMLRPFVGLKTALISQANHTTWHDPIDTLSDTYLFDTATEVVRQDFWGIGPSLGVKAMVPIARGPGYTVSVFAAPSGSVMYGRWKFAERFETDGPTSTTTPDPTVVEIRQNSINGISTMGRGVVGIEWTQQHARMASTVRLGYEAQVWLNQMQYYSYNMGRLNNVMALQGVLVELSFTY